MPSNEHQRADSKKLMPHIPVQGERSETSRSGTSRGQKRRESPAHETQRMKRVELSSEIMSKDSSLIQDAADDSSQAFPTTNPTKPKMVGPSHLSPPEQSTPTAKAIDSDFDEGRSSDDSVFIPPKPPLDMDDALLCNRFSFVSSDPDQKKRWNTGTLFGSGSATGLLQYHLPELNQAIRQFIYDATPDHISAWDDLDSATRARIEAVTPEGRNYIHGRSNIWALSRAWIWRVLWDNLLSPDCVDKWNGASWASFGALVRDLRANVSQEDSDPTIAFHQMRYGAARLLYMTHGYQSDHVRLRSILADHLGPLIRMTDQDFNVAEQQLDAIAVAAIRFHLVTLSSKCDIHVDLRDPKTKKFWGFEYQPGSKLYDGRGFPKNDPSAMTVDLVVHPSIRVFGTKDFSFPGSIFYYSNYGHESETEQMVVQRGLFFKPRYMNQILAQEKASTSQSGEGASGVDEPTAKEPSAVATVKGGKEGGEDDGGGRGNKSDEDDEEEDEDVDVDVAKKSVKDSEKNDDGEADKDEVDVEMEGNGSEKSGSGEDDEDEDDEDEDEVDVGMEGNGNEKSGSGEDDEDEDDEDKDDEDKDEVDVGMEGNSSEKSGSGEDDEDENEVDVGMEGNGSEKSGSGEDDEDKDDEDKDDEDEDDEDEDDDKDKLRART